MNVFWSHRHPWFCRIHSSSASDKYNIWTSCRWLCSI